MNISGGHAGLVRHILVTTENAMRNQIDTSRLTWKEMFKYLNSKNFDLSIYNNVRAVPIVDLLSDEKISFCEQILNGKILYPNFNKHAVDLVKSGILIIIDSIYLTFAAPLLKRSFFQQHYGKVEISTVEIPKDLHHFIVKIFTLMCDERSGYILREKLEIKSDGRILEQTWRKEFYRIGTNYWGINIFCHVMRAQFLDVTER
jgi:hypothetical protein